MLDFMIYLLSQLGQSRVGRNKSRTLKKQNLRRWKYNLRRFFCLLISDTTLRLRVDKIFQYQFRSGFISGSFHERISPVFQGETWTLKISKTFIGHTMTGGGFLF